MKTRTTKIIKAAALLAAMALVAALLAACGYFTTPDGRLGFTDAKGTPFPFCFDPSTFDPSLCGAQSSAPGGLATAVPTRPATLGTPGATAPTPQGGTVISTRNDMFRVVLMADGRIWQDQYPSPATAEQPSYEVQFNVPATMPGGMNRTYAGIRCTLLKDGQVVASRANSISLTLTSGTYVARCDAGNNNSFALELGRTVEASPAPGKPGVVSVETDWRRVILEPDGRIWQDQIYEGAPSYEVTFTVPANLPGGNDRTFKGTNAVLHEGDKNGPTLAGNVAAKTVTLKPGQKYTVVGGDKNGGFALELVNR